MTNQTKCAVRWQSIPTRPFSDPSWDRSLAGSINQNVHWRLIYLAQVICVFELVLLLLVGMLILCACPLLDRLPHVSAHLSLLGLVHASLTPIAARPKNIGPASPNSKPLPCACLAKMRSITARSTPKKSTSAAVIDSVCKPCQLMTCDRMALLNAWIALLLDILYFGLGADPLIFKKHGFCTEQDGVPRDWMGDDGRDMLHAVLESVRRPSVSLICASLRR